VEATDWNNKQCLQALNGPLQKPGTTSRTKGQAARKRKKLVQKTYQTVAKNA